MTEPVPRPPRAPRQRRAVATRQRLYEAAMAEYGRVGLQAARVEDIVAAAGVSWGTFFHYFPTKEDVLLEASATVCRAFAAAAATGLEAGQDTETVLRQAFEAMFQAAAAVAEARSLRGAMLNQVVNHPGRLTAYLGDEVPTPVRATTEVLAEGQRNGEIRADEPAEALAVIVLYAVLFSTRRSATLGRPAGSSPLSQLALQIVLRGMRPGDRNVRPGEPTPVG
jgi:TetR/AcrR family transcriptional regulator, fatty acid metabolism regulator protein